MMQSREPRLPSHPHLFAPIATAPAAPLSSTDATHAQVILKEHHQARINKKQLCLSPARQTRLKRLRAQRQPVRILELFALWMQPPCKAQQENTRDPTISSSSFHHGVVHR